MGIKLVKSRYNTSSKNYLKNQLDLMYKLWKNQYIFITILQQNIQHKSFLHHPNN